MVQRLQAVFCMYTGPFGWSESFLIC
uniref:Uncharacterized protein n=1 Tax=Arundo donax TaxID=35708 RepID=A0A0A8Y7G6_ARUDO